MTRRNAAALAILLLMLLALLLTGGNGWRALLPQPQPSLKQDPFAGAALPGGSINPPAERLEQRAAPSRPSR